MNRTRAAQDTAWLTVLVVVASVQIAWGAGQLLGASWFPQGDEAIVALHTHDVFSAHPPLLGMRSTSNLSNPGVWAHHPGPMQFYLLAIPYAASGFSPWGLIVGSALISIILVAIAIVAGFRAGRWPGACCAAGVTLVLEYFFRSSLERPLNAWPPILGLLAVLMLAWRLHRGDVRALPLYVACASLTAQCHIGFLPVVLVLSAFLGAVALARAWTERGWSHRRRLRWPWLTGVALLVLCWLPPFFDLLVTHPNNLHELSRLTTGSTASAPVGWGVAAKHVLLMLVPLSIFPTNVSQAVLLVKGDTVFAAPAANVAVFGVCALVVVAVLLPLWESRRTLLRARRPSDPALPDLVVVSLVASLALIWATATLTRTRVIYSDLMIAAPLCVTAAAIWQVCRVVRRHVPAVGRRTSQPPAAVGVAAVCVVAAVVILPDSQLLRLLGGRESDWRAARSVVLPVSAAVGSEAPNAPVRVDCQGFICMASTAPAVSAQLLADGHQVYYDKTWPRQEDDDFRRLKHAPQDAVTVVMRERDQPDSSTPQAAPGASWTRQWRQNYYGHEVVVEISVVPAASHGIS